MLLHGSWKKYYIKPDTSLELCAVSVEDIWSLAEQPGEWPIAAEHVLTVESSRMDDHHHMPFKRKMEKSHNVV